MASLLASGGRAPQPARAPPAKTAPAGDRELAKAQALYDDAHYPDAIAVLDEVINRKDASAADVLRARLLAGMSHLALAHEEAARSQFRALLRRDPDYVLPPYTSPKIAKLFEAVRREVKLAAQLEPLPPQLTQRPSGTFDVRLRLRSRGLAASALQVRWRQRGAQAYQPVPLSQADGELQAVLETQVSRGAAGPQIDIEYYVAWPQADGTVVTLGTEAEPLAVRVQVEINPALVARAESPPLYTRWWLWTTVGVVLAGGAVATYFLIANPQPSAHPVGALDLNVSVAR
jgi:hypothetical protein